MGEKELHSIENNRLIEKFVWMESEEYEALKEKILSFFDSEER